jgi:hypothetical protein
MLDRNRVKRLLLILSTAATGMAVAGGALAVLVQGIAPTVASAAAVAPAAVSAASGDSLQLKFEQQVKPLFQKYCYSCHANGKDKGDLALDKYPTILSIQHDRLTWQKVADNTLAGAMPPKKKPQPTAEEKKLIGDWIGAAFDWFDPNAPIDPGRVTVKRLNRTEYNNTIRDLLGVSFKPASNFPADDTGYGFDNIGDVLSISPLHAEKYLSAAEDVVDAALQPPEPPEPKTVRRNPGDLQGAGEVKDGARTLASEGETFREESFLILGSYDIRVRATADQAGPELAKMSIRFDGKEVKQFEVKDPPPTQRRKSNDYTVRVPVTVAGPHRVAVAFLNDYYNPDNPDPAQQDRNLHIQSIEVAGPFNVKVEPSELFKSIFVVMPGNGVSDEDAAKQVLKKFAGRAYRRPATDDEVKQLVELFKLAKADGNDFVGATKIALTAALVSPNFLFRVEKEQSSDPSKPYPISDYELATRLSYFLWSSMPDDELLAKAGANELHKPEVLKQQVRRMLGDEKAEALVSNFIGQWLELRNIDGATVDRKVFPFFNERLRADMRREVETFFDHLVREDRSVLDLLTADYTYINERLARHYGIDGISGEGFRKVSLQNSHRAGVLTMAGVLTVTSMPTRTAPVKRGKFILEEILGTPIPPPPAEVPPLSEKPADVSAKSLRERLQVHREDATCNSCHSRMDPLGFALENFDAIGKWRDKDGSFDVDASGVLPEGQAFKGPEELLKIVGSRKDEFVRTFTGKLMTYALGRGMEPYDKRTIKDISDATAKGGYKFSTLINEIVMSDAFQKRRAKRGEE